MSAPSGKSFISLFAVRQAHVKHQEPVLAVCEIEAICLKPSVESMLRNLRCRASAWKLTPYQPALLLWAGCGASAVDCRVIIPLYSPYIYIYILVLYMRVYTCMYIYTPVEIHGYTYICSPEATPLKPSRGVSLRSLPRS